MSPKEDLDLLRRFEPVLRFTRGEHFFPMDVDPYVRLCSLWARRPHEDSICLARRGELNLNLLPQAQLEEAAAISFLKVTEPLSPTELALYYLTQRRSPEKAFHAGTGRLARVGYVSRFVDAAFTVTLLARGRVPGDAEAAAIITYDQLMAEQEHYCYQGRVIRENGWIVLQYWFFYLYDDWRTGFFGANDHEADWEMICLYLSESESGEVKPAWAAYAAHNESGDDLRRRWDDPELEKIGEHPVVYVGAGSHASYFRRGEYLAEVELPFLATYIRITDDVQRFWHQKLRQYGGEEPQAYEGGGANLFRVPFVDYARGNGLTLGPGQEKEWGNPRLLSPSPLWVTNYEGLWGLYANDPFQGEDAPPGPMYNRDGTVRRAWYDPVGWSGLDKVPPYNAALSTLVQQRAEIESKQTAATLIIEQKAAQLHGLGLEAAALQRGPHEEKIYETYRRRITELSRELDQLRAQTAADAILLDSLDSYAERVKAGEREPARTHIRHPNEPTPEEELRLGRLAEVWAASSVALMLLGFLWLVLFDPQHLVFGLIAIITLFVFIEAAFRRRLIGLVTGVTITLALVAALILLFEFFWPIVVLAVLVAGLYILWENLRELWS